MKTKYTVMAALLVISGAAAAQEVDDMYFNARDRVSHTEATQAAMAVRYAAEDRQATKANPVNPSDTYTGRGVNPEFSAQQKNGAEIVQGNPDYFLASYKPKGVNSNLNVNNSSYSNACACNPYGGFGNPYGSFYSPYGYSPYSMMGYGGMGMYPYGMGMYPYGMGYGSSMSISMMYGMGSMYYGLGYGMGSMYGSPYGMYNPYAYYSPYTTPVYGYDPMQTIYGRRPVRVSNAAQSYAYANPGYAAGTNGRTRSTQTGSNYYNPGWRNDPSNFPTRTYNGGRTGSYYPSSGSRSMWDNPGGTRSRSFDSFGSGSRSMGMPSGGSSGGGGGRSRGRN